MEMHTWITVKCKSLKIYYVATHSYAVRDIFVPLLLNELIKPNKTQQIVCVWIVFKTFLDPSAERKIKERRYTRTQTLNNTSYVETVGMYCL